MIKNFFKNLSFKCSRHGRCFEHSEEIESYGELPDDYYYPAPHVEIVIPSNLFRDTDKDEV